MEETLIKRVFPHSLEVEQSVIGSMLMDREAMIAASEIVARSDFYQQQYGIMFGAMVELFNEGKPVDLVTLQGRLREKDVPPEVSSLGFIRDIVTMVPTSANVRSYTTIAGEKAVLRRLIKTMKEIANTCYAGKESLENILADTEKFVFNLLQSRGGQDFMPIKQVTINVLEKIEDAYKNQGTVTGIPSDFINLDYKLSGFQPSDFILIIAHPSMGKAAFILNVVDYVAVHRSLFCMVFNLEMSKGQLVDRMPSTESNVDSQKLRTGSLTDSDWDAVVEGIGIIENSKLITDDTPGISISEPRSRCRKMKLEYGLSIVIIGYLQLMSGSKEGGGDNRQQEISDISRSLEAPARELHASVIALSQLSRACETRRDHRPMLSGLRESGTIEQGADVVVFLYHSDYYNKGTEHPSEAEVIIAKQYDGPIGTITLIWKPEYTRFVSAARPQSSGQNAQEFFQDVIIPILNAYTSSKTGHAC